MRIDVAERCPDTSAIRTDEGRQHCTRCHHDVLDLCFVTERRAVELMAAERVRTGRVCISLFTDADGVPSFLVEPRPRRRLPVLPLAFAATMASACGVDETAAPSRPPALTARAEATGPAPVEVVTTPVAVAPASADAVAPATPMVDASVCSSALDAGALVDATSRAPASVRRTRPAVGHFAGMSGAGPDVRFESPW